MVNAPWMAGQGGVEVSVTRHDREPDYQTLVRLTVRSEGRSRVLAGTLIGGRQPRMVDVQGIAVEADFGRHMLYVRNYDKPCLIGALGTALGRHALHISTFHLGRPAFAREEIVLVNNSHTPWFGQEAFSQCRSRV